MNVAWDDGEEEQAAIQYKVPVTSAQHRNGQRREEDVDSREKDPISEATDSMHLDGKGSFASSRLPLGSVCSVSCFATSPVQPFHERNMAR